MTSSLDGQKATLANELPPELLVHIFEMAQSIFFPLEQHSSWRFPLVLGKVSRYWRQVAYGAPTSTLWSNVDISLAQDLGGLQVYLGRSKNSPIDLSITFAPNISKRGVSMLIGILQPHYQRCRSIKVASELPYESTTEISSILGSMCQGHYPMLQHICVEGLEISLDLPPFAIVADAVNLTSVRLRGLGLGSCRPPLNSVTQLHLAVYHYPIHYIDFFKMLQSCRSLVTLCVYDDLFHEWPIDFYETHDMPFLRYLRIFGDMPEVSELLLSISAPDLEELTIAPIAQDDLDYFRGETSTAPRFSALKTLTLSPDGDSKLTTVADANACFPGIKLLILPNFNTISSFVGSFKTTDSQAFWPELDGLAVRDIDDQSVLYELVQDRQRLGVPLRSLYLDPLSMSRMTRMEWLKDQLSVVEADPWKLQCQNAFYCNEEDRFLGEE